VTRSAFFVNDFRNVMAVRNLLTVENKIIYRQSGNEKY